MQNTQFYWFDCHALCAGSKNITLACRTGIFEKLDCYFDDIAAVDASVLVLIRIQPA